MAAKSKKCNENFIHNCGGPQIEIAKYIKPITDMEYSLQEIRDIFYFYLLNAPILKSDKSNDAFGLKSLKKYGWRGNAELSKLEGRLLKSAKLSLFCIIKSKSIDGTLEMMDLMERSCIEHPRAVIKRNCSVTLHEDGTIDVAPSETRMECLFRHIRNSIAHNRTYDFQNGNIMLEDYEENRISARILIPRVALLDWIDIVKKREQV